MYVLTAFTNSTKAPSIWILFIPGPEENVASLKFGSQVIQGDFRENLLDDNTTTYDLENGKTSTAISYV